jgi:8-oxo-dGTP pyrophosphatase MutT (NUDIX family)
MLRQALAWFAYRLIRVFWWIRRPVVLGVRVLVIEDNRVLLVRHSYREGWFLPGGRPEFDETLAQTAKREVREETGSSISEAELFGVYSRLSESLSNHVVVFVATPHETSLPTTTPGEIEAVQWRDVGNLPVDADGQTKRILWDWKHGRRGNYDVVSIS